MPEPLTILVVEDDRIYADFVATTLEAAGHAVEVTHDGATARTVARTRQLHAVILDLSLPDESGFDLARALRASLPAATVLILLTANLYPERDVADAVGIDLVLTKPVEPRLVADMVDLIRIRRERKLGRGGCDGS